KEYLGTSLDDALYKVLKKHDADIIKEHSIPAKIIERLRKQYVPEKSTKHIRKIMMEHARKQQEPKETITSSDTTALEEFDQKTTLFETMTKSKSFNKSPKQRALYHTLMELILEDKDAMDEGVPDKLKKRKQDDADKDEGPSAGSDRGLKRRKTRKDTEPSKKGTSKSQPESTAAPKHDWFKKLERPPTPDSDWNVRKSIDFRPPQTWISKIAQEEKPPLSFDELMRNPIDFSTYVMNHLKIDKMTLEHLVGPTFNLLKGTCKSRVELEYNFEECYKALTGRLDWNNPEGKEYPFDLTQARNIQLPQQKKAAKYDIPSIKGMVPSLWSPVKVAYDRYDVWGISHWVLNDNDSMDSQEIGRIVILKRVEDLQLGVKSYQKKLNITKPETFRSDISNRTPYTTYNNPQGIIYVDKYNKNMLMRSDELYKFSDGTLTSVRQTESDTKVFTMKMEILPEPTSNKLCGRMWDVNAATGRYLSTEFIIFDVEPNKDKFCVMRYADFMLEFDGATTVRKYFVKSEGFISSLLMVTMFLNSSGVEMMKETLSAANTEVKAGTLENLLMWAYNQKYDVGHLLFDIPLLELRRHDRSTVVVIFSQRSRYDVEGLTVKQVSLCVDELE
ncbi:hypothetical protein Tco_0576987, partial [Tanacetum coccineum]